MNARKEIGIMSKGQTTATSCAMSLPRLGSNLWGLSTPTKPTLQSVNFLLERQIDFGPEEFEAFRATHKRSKEDRCKR
jgi:hypothetical protein